MNYAIADFGGANPCFLVIESNGGWFFSADERKATKWPSLEAVETYHKKFAREFPLCSSKTSIVPVIRAIK